MMTDWGFELAKSYSLPSTMLTADGRLALRIAARLADGEIAEREAWSFAHGQKVDTSIGKSLLLFVGRPNRTFPASSNSLKDSGIGYIRICQRYVSQIRILCLRIWSDEGVLPGVGEGGKFAFPRKPKYDIPFGVESLWLPDGSLGDNSPEFVPDWYSGAAAGLSTRRHALFRESVAYAILFTFLHEYSHLVCRHEDRRDEILLHERELEADALAVQRLLLMLDGGLSDEDCTQALDSVAVGILSAFMVFHLLVLHASPVTAGRLYHRGYPTPGERLSQVLQIVQRAQLTEDASVSRHTVRFMKICNQLAGLHPAFAFVIGTG